MTASLGRVLEMGIIELLVVLTILASAFRGVLAAIDAGTPGVLLGFFIGAGVGWLCSVTIVLLFGASFMLVAQALGVDLDGTSKPQSEPKEGITPKLSRWRMLKRSLGQAGLATLGILLLGLPIGIAWLASRAVAALINRLWG